MLKFKLPARWMAGAMMVLLAALTACGGSDDSPAEPTLSATMPTSGTTGTAVSITAISETNGSSMSVDWGDGTTENEPTVASTSLSHTYSTAGSYAIVLTLRRTVLDTVKQTGTVVIAAPPTLSATLPTVGTVGTAVSISSIAAANGTALSVNWGDGTTEAPATSVTSLSHTYSTAGSYVIDLVLSGSGTPAEKTGTIVVGNAADATLTATLPTAGTVGTAVSISSITAANGTALSVNWGDGTTETPDVTSTSLSHTYSAAGSYVIDMVLSGAGASAEKTGTVVVSAVSAADLFISEYIEGSSNNKALEIYNPTSSTVDLSLYSMATYSNGGTSTGYTKALTGTLAPGKTLVIYNPSAGTALVAATATASSTDGATVLADGTYPSQVTLFNGNDAVVLMKSGVVIDSFGVVGNDPGSTGWGAITTDHTLRRKAGIVHGTIPDATATWDPTVEWDVYAKDTFDGLGIR